MGGSEASVVGDRVLAARRRAGMTREELAYRTGLSWSAIAQIESGRRPNPRAETIAALARALHLPADHLLGHDGTVRDLFTHQALIYGGVDDFVATVGPFVARGLEHGEPTLVVTTRRCADGLREHLGDAAEHVRFGDSEGWYGSPKAAFTSFRDFTNEALLAGAPWVRIVGELVWRRRSPEDIERWARYESLLNLTMAGRPVTLVCPYDETALPEEIVRHARTAHASTLAGGETSPNEEFRDPAEFFLGD